MLDFVAFSKMGFKSSEYMQEGEDFSSIYKSAALC